MSSIVRHKDKKSGRIIVYESTSRYIDGKSRPKRKYLGVEDPITHELIPSSGRPGRRKKHREVEDIPSASQSKSGAVSVDSGLAAAAGEYGDIQLKNQALEKEIDALRQENQTLREAVQSAREILSHVPIDR